MKHMPRNMESNLSKAIPDGLEPLTREAVKKEYFLLEEEAAAAGFDVLPGYFLPKMRERIKQIVEN